jgi:histone deacetylase complex regulatory component SIN3
MEVVKVHFHARKISTDRKFSYICIFFCVGNMETTIFEDTCREMFGVHAYIVFTIDKLVQNIVRQVS